MGDLHNSVTVQPFCMDRTEVTVAAYTACVKAGRCTFEDRSQCTSHGTFQRQDMCMIYKGIFGDHRCNYLVPGRDEHPINCVTWGHATTYCAAQGKRLPTEEEWEWAARGGPLAHVFPWGDGDPDAGPCWLTGVQPEGTCPVGSHPGDEAPGGIRDLAGNVEEWTSSTPPHNDTRVLRGGAFNLNGRESFRAASWGHGDPSLIYPFVGFRCASE